MSGSWFPCHRLDLGPSLRLRNILRPAQILLPALLMLLLLGSRSVATEAGLLPQAQARQQQAEAELAGARSRIQQERETMAAAILQHADAIDRLRALIMDATRERDAAQAAAEQQRLAASQDALSTRLAIDRVVIAAHLPPAREQALLRASADVRLQAALAGLQDRLQSLSQHLALGFAREVVIGRDGRQLEAPVLRLGQARALALGVDHNTRGVLASAGASDLPVVSGPELPSGMASGAPVDLVALDVDNSLAGQQAGSRSLREWLRAGRFFIWPILGVLALGLAIALERISLLLHDRVDPRLLTLVLGHLRAARPTDAWRLVEAGASPLERVLKQGLAALPLSRPSREAALEESLLGEAPRLQRGLGLLMVLASIAPLLGLLGTVTGMIDMFRVIAAHGSGNARSLSGSISEALVTTQAGMIVAVPLLVIHALLARAVERRLMTLEEGGTALLALEAPGAPGAPSTAPAASGADAPTLPPGTAPEEPLTVLPAQPPGGQR